MAKEESHFAIYASIAANLAIAASKFTAAAITGSSGMLAEGIHSLVDSGDGFLLLLGRSRAKQPPDRQHPLGHAQELYFWSFIVAIVFFAVGGGMSVYEGIVHVLHPEPVTEVTWSYVTLGLALLFDGTSFVIATRNFVGRIGDQGVISAMLASKDPSVFSVVLEDSADLVGIVLAFLGVFLSRQLDMPVLDGVASIGVGLVLATVAVFLGIQCKGLLVGESADPETVDRIEEVVRADPHVRRFDPPVTIHLGPHDILVALGIEFERTLSAPDVAAAVVRIEKQIRERIPGVGHIYVESQGEAEVEGRTSKV